MDNLYALNIERAVLSSIFFDPEVIEDTNNILKANDFYLPAHQKIYEAMLDLYDNDMPIDEEFVRKRVNSKEVDDSVIIEILSANAITNTLSYAKEIKEASIKRELVSLATLIKKVTIEDELHSTEAIDTIQSALNNVSSRDDISGLMGIDKIVDEFDEQFKEASKTDKFLGTQTGLKRFDNLIGAFAPGDLVVIGARPSMGKTALSTTITTNQLKDGHSVLFDSLEMDAPKLMRRLIATYADENITDLKKGMCTNPQNYQNALKFFRSLKNEDKFILHDLSYPSIRQLKSKAIRVFKQNPHIRTWIIDHLRFIKMSTRDRHLEVANVTKELKSIAKEYGITVILLTQLNRDVQQRHGNNHRPQLSDLRDSGAIEEDADIVIFPHRPSYYTRTDPTTPEMPINEAEIIVAKNRDGLTGVTKCQFKGSSTKFIDDGFSVTMYENSCEAIDMPEIDV